MAVTQLSSVVLGIIRRLAIRKYSQKFSAEAQIFKGTF